MLVPDPSVLVLLAFVVLGSLVTYHLKVSSIHPGSHVVRLTLIDNSPELGTQLVAYTV